MGRVRGRSATPRISRAVASAGRGRAGCRGGDQIAVDAKELGDCGEGGVERAQPGRHGWLGLVVGDF
jgi:hypothetical protein